MPYAVAHFLIPVILLELFRDFFIKDKKSFPIYYIVIGGIAGLIPDLDIAIFYLLSFTNFSFNFFDVHRVFLHNLFLPLLFILLALIFYNFKSETLGNRHLKLKNIFLILAFGTFVHLLLDFLVWGQILPFYPINYYSIGLNLYEIFPISWQGSIIQTVDAILLVLWISYLAITHKVRELL